MPPTLGITEVEDSSGNKIRRVDTFIPGMILSLDQSKYNGEGENFKRLYSPLSAHTTSKKSRSCISCHNDPLAIGYGEGQLVYHTKGKLGYWAFTPKYAEVEYDKVPEDAWIGFRSQIENLASTRSNSRPFNIEEQIRILTVGACLTCHKEGSKIIVESLNNFENVKKRITSKCAFPVWE